MPDYLIVFSPTHYVCECGAKIRNSHRAIELHWFCAVLANALIGTQMTAIFSAHTSTESTTHHDDVVQYIRGFCRDFFSKQCGEIFNNQFVVFDWFVIYLCFPYIVLVWR